MGEAVGGARKLGVNGFGRIGKLTVWHHIARKYFDEIVVNIGREVGTSFYDIVHYLERDSSYGRLRCYLHGHHAEDPIRSIDESRRVMNVDGVRITFLQTDRNPCHIGWRDRGVKLVIDTTGRFLDPTRPGEDPQGSIRGHLESGAEKVVVSAPFKVKDAKDDLRGAMPEDAVTTVMGINTNDFDPRRHRIVSNASCTTTCLAHMMKPLLDHFGPQKILTASMATVHAATGSQSVLDRLPQSNKKDLRKNRSIMNNIILTTTGAAKALRLVIPEMAQIGFIAESVRVPTATGSLIILVVDFQEEPAGEPIRREAVNAVYREASSLDPNGYLHYSDKQNVSGDIIGFPRAAAIIEGYETHTRTAEVTIDLTRVPALDGEIVAKLNQPVIRIPVTQTVIYGWYDNEMGSYVNMLGDRTVSIAELM